MSKSNPLVEIVKDLQKAFKSYKSALKQSKDQTEILSTQLNFLKITKTVVGLFKNNSNDIEIKTLKKQAQTILQAYESLQKDQLEAIGNTEIIFEDFQESKEVYQNKSDLDEKLQHEKNLEISKLHQDLQDLNHIFKDFSILVDNQGTDLNKILYDIEGAERTTARVNTELESANHWYKQSRSKCCWISIIISSLLSILGGIVAAVFLTKS